MCELGSQGGLDGRWHCSAAQVDVLLLFQHADICFCSIAHFLSLPLSGALLYFPLSPFSVDKTCKDGDKEGGCVGLFFSSLCIFLETFKLNRCDEAYDVMMPMVSSCILCLPCDGWINNITGSFPGERGGQLTGVMSQIRGGALLHLRICFCFPNAFLLLADCTIHSRTLQGANRCLWINSKAWWLGIDQRHMSAVMCFPLDDWFLCYLDPGKGTEVY